MNFTVKEMVFSACLFSIGVAIYMVGSVLHDFDIAIAQMQSDIQIIKEETN